MGVNMHTLKHLSNTSLHALKLKHRFGIQPTAIEHLNNIRIQYISNVI